MDLFVVSGIKSKCAVSEKTGINTWNELKSVWRTALVFQLSLPNSCLSLLSTFLPKPFSSYGWDRLPFILIHCHKRTGKIKWNVASTEDHTKLLLTFGKKDFPGIPECLYIPKKNSVTFLRKGLFEIKEMEQEIACWVWHCLELLLHTQMIHLIVKHC